MSEVAENAEKRDYNVPFFRVILARTLHVDVSSQQTAKTTWVEHGVRNAWVSFISEIIPSPNQRAALLLSRASKDKMKHYQSPGRKMTVGWGAVTWRRSVHWRIMIDTPLRSYELLSSS
jgi:hypothetical protein